MSEERKGSRKKKPDRLKPLSLYPLTLEKALSAFMRVKPRKVKKAAALKVQKKPE